MNLLQEEKFARFREAATTGDFPNLLREDYQDMVLSAYGEVDQPLVGLARTLPSDLQTETYRGLTPMQDITQIVPEGGEFGEIRLSEKATRSITNYKRGAMIAVTWEMIRYNKLAEFNRLGNYLGNSIGRSVELAVRDVIETTTNTATSSAGTLTLNRANLETQITYFKKQTATCADASTVPLGIVPDTLLIPPDLEFEARRLLQSALIPGAHDNDVNVLKSMLNIAVSHDLSSTSVWYILKKSWLNGLVLQTVEGPPPQVAVQDIKSTQTDGVIRYDKILYRGKVVFGSGVLDTAWCLRSTN